MCVCVLFWQEATWHFDIKPLRLGRLRARIGYWYICIAITDAKARLRQMKQETWDTMCLYEKMLGACLSASWVKRKNSEMASQRLCTQWWWCCWWEWCALDAAARGASILKEGGQLAPVVVGVVVVVVVVEVMLVHQCKRPENGIEVSAWLLPDCCWCWFC